MPLNRLLIYARDIEATRHSEDRIVELVNPDGGGRLMLHQAGRLPGAL